MLDKLQLHIQTDIRPGLHGGLSMSEHFRPAPGSKAFQEVRRKLGRSWGQTSSAQEALEEERGGQAGSHYLTERPTYKSPGFGRIRLAGGGKQLFIPFSYKLLMQTDVAIF